VVKAVILSEAKDLLFSFVQKQILRLRLRMTFIPGERSMNRREMLAGLGGVAASAAFARLDAQLSENPLGATAAPLGSFELPRKNDFMIEDGYTYINAAYTHPIPKVSLEAARRAAENRGSLRAPAANAGGGRGTSGGGGGGGENNNPRALFAELIGAKPTEIAYVSSTSAGENLVVSALGLDHDFSGNVVTDGLHYDGAILHLMELKKRGLDLRIVKPTKDYRIDLKDMERVVDNKTKLIEVSSAAMYNGFQHDLKAVADLAHAHGAFVYADIIHSAGAEPFDVKASGIDFAACSSFKWLMGDFGMGFLYAREDVLPKIRRPVIGYIQASRMEGFYPPNLPAGEYTPVDYALNNTAAGMFESGTLASGSSVNQALLGASLRYVKDLGVANIQMHRQPLLKRLRDEVPRFGFTCVTPPDATGGNITFAYQNVNQSPFPQKLQAAKVNVRFSRNWMRLSPSVYNDMADIERFLNAM
jgi:selenocysteine lyase/cysteine desulfurase